jgi:hypothetical protein
MKKLILLLAIVLSGILEQAYGQNFEGLDEYTVNEVYQKVDLEYGTLDENGQLIDYIFVITEADPGIYEIDISDGPGDLYQINGTDLYIELREYFGYAGYSDECILVVHGSGYYPTLYDIDD